MRSTNGKKPARDKLRLKRATESEKEERIVQTMRLVIMGYSTADVKQWFRSTLDLQWCQALRYLRLARERLAEETGLTEEFTLEDMKVQHYSMYMAIAHANSGEETKDRLNALKHAGSIYGVQAPTKVAQTTPDGQTPYVQASFKALREMSVEQLAILAEVGERREAILSRPNPGSH